MEDGELQDYNMPLYAENPVSVQQTEESLKLDESPEFEEEPEPIIHNLLTPVEVIEPNEQAINEDLKKRLFTDNEDGMLTFCDSLGRSKGKNFKSNTIIFQVVLSVLNIIVILLFFVFLGLMIWILICFNEPCVLMTIVVFPFLSVLVLILVWAIYNVGITYTLKFDDKNSQIVYEKRLLLFYYSSTRKRTEWGYDEIKDFVVELSNMKSDSGERLATIKMVNTNNEKIRISSNKLLSKQKNVAGGLKKSLAERLNIS